MTATPPPEAIAGTSKELEPVVLSCPQSGSFSTVFDVTTATVSGTSIGE
eukprot:CAMPEP_0196723654 /NCGR_PEP_ID=MMETSP1091-20130531/5742_1 /TAXON_ID=302021 /ORGANISM="Rhodomonas sp., Strain CCMP768" /LENGTH=48 /DNA_ID= /DNA_START= /DNA_END= /DNA_ORIENTATION=